ncbi:hypothetical protein O3G_MSEX004491 [Manduca sexta]|uniref:BPTI/Kunitz inhibitor domain-containing protein n=1 Tax=Manduca sexta TaxID=7130 RepID=A0A921YV60_MANSE|nr:hypothetical protein O3G_MSEX004491 [Manduca sexta]
MPAAWLTGEGVFLETKSLETGMTGVIFYYDVKMEDCKTFTFGLCGKSKNHFETRNECRDRCQEIGLHEARANVSEKIYCRYQPDFGDCNNYHPMFYFDITQRFCRGFSYSGCGGNLNRFPNAQICTAVCAGAVEYY